MEQEDRYARDLEAALHASLPRPELGREREGAALTEHMPAAVVHEGLPEGLPPGATADDVEVQHARLAAAHRAIVLAPASS